MPRLAVLAVLTAAALGAAAAMIDTRYSAFDMVAIKPAWPLMMGVLSLLCAWWLIRDPEAGSFAAPPSLSPPIVLGLAFIACLLTGWLAGAAWPNSGDEYGYTYLAKTLLAGRLANAPPPLQPLFDTWHISTVAGKTFAYYAPGWPAVIALFDVVGIERVTSPALTLMMGYALLRGMRLLGVPAPLQGLGLAAILFSPFILLNGASLYPHAATGALVGLIIWVRLSDDARPAWFKGVLIGLLFSLLLQVRYETFLVVLGVYGVERLLLRRARAVPEFVLAGIGAIPSVLFFLYYNWAITGNALLPPYSWANPHYHLGLWGFGDDGQHSPARGLLHAGIWIGELAEYAGFALIPPYLVALVVKLRRGTLRFFDVMLPVVILFYFLQPDNGGHRYGPRYWYYGWPPVILTIMSGLPTGSERRVSVAMLINLAFCAGAFPILVLVTRLYIDARREVYATLPPTLPAVVLVPNRSYIGAPWQYLPNHAYPGDFTRNDPDFQSPVLYGDGTVPDAVALACQLRGRHVYSWTARGRYAEEACPAG
ncbi:MAG: hypothetical protein NVSMB18_25480 [Acetobacteraceae bacterium]